MNEVSISDDDRRLLALWTADCAERALALFEAEAPGDTRPREAVEGARAFAREGRRTALLRARAHAALAAAREVDDPAAAAAARAAGYAAASPYIHPLATPHQVKHALEPAVHAALALELAAGAGAVGGGAGGGAVVGGAAPAGPAVGEGEIRRAAEHAPPAVRALVGRFPECAPGRTRPAVLRRQLDEALRG
ncbi:putative immunity protein [Kitasatospora sp. NBC_00458]|uniref:putative immunity protein n=1 Tax=Kitasatospora sp. NBC_00458 TaxID=2903568 RepID=UPI002E16E7E2